MISVLLVLFLSSASLGQDPKFSSCKIPSTSWDTAKAKSILLNVTSYYDCVNSCKNAGYCNFFTWNDKDHPYFKNTCALFSGVGSQQECNHCISGAMSCFCNNPTACKDTGHNLVGVHIGLWGESECESRCNLNTQCTNYTFFTERHKYSKLCLLYSECPEVDRSCAGCCSGTKTFDPCSSTNYRKLSSPVRHVFSTHPDSTRGNKYKDGDLASADQYSWYNVLPDWKESGWYRFTDQAGSRLADKFPGYKKCGSDNPLYLLLDEDNKLPTPGVGKPMQVCQPSAYRKERCPYKHGINVMNCGHFFVYELNNKCCDHTYCGAGSVDEDDDNDGVPDVEDLDDFDSDGIPDDWDDDDDNDGVPDDEDDDDDNDGVPDDWDDGDLDNDGIPDDEDTDDDNDGVPDDEDADDDNDGIPDAQDMDDDNDGIADDWDGDNDGVTDDEDNDFDNDGIPDVEDPDDDNDGILDVDDPDDNNDGIPDNCDDDEDNDGVPDCEDSDVDNDGIPDNCDDDEDNDGVPDCEDSDVDNDGVRDDEEY